MGADAPNASLGRMESSAVLIQFRSDTGLYRIGMCLMPPLGRGDGMAAAAIVLLEAD